MEATLNTAVRSIVVLPALFLAGVGAGYALFNRPAEITRPATKPSLEQGLPASAESLPANASSTDEKAQRLVAAALRKGSEIDRLSELYLSIQALSAEDFRRLTLDVGAIKAMIDKLKGVDGETGGHLASGLVDRWLAVDPAMVITLAPRILDLIPKGERGRSFILDALAERRPEEMLALVSPQKAPAERAEIISRALRELASKDLAKAQAWLNACTDPGDKRVAEQALRLGIVKADPLRAIELATATDNRTEGFDIIRAAAKEAARMGLGTARQLATMPMKGWMLSPLLADFAERDPDLAVALALKSLTGSDHDAQGSSLSSAFSSLARRDPTQAISKLEGLRSPQLAFAVTAIGDEWAICDPAAALSWLIERPAEDRNNPHQMGYGSNDCLLYTFSEWMVADRKAALAWADALPAGETRDKVQLQMARVLAIREEPAQATQILFTLGQAADPKTFSDVARSWARIDPQAAADWAIAQPAGPMQGRALASVVGAWAVENPAAVKDWLAQFPPGEARDRSITAFLCRGNLWAESIKDQAAEFDAWFGLIEDSWQRAIAARRSYWARHDEDSQGARAWLTSLTNVDPALIRMTLRHGDN